ncbi:TPR-domain containing protein [Methanosarcina lacustris Z-7289]|uniref:TPR-domain containing protein n=1 Tax=Methanosarcina lacustris Z-7289 TaxID=1434111 RepID=A0A0E3S7T7_9EURY|nr:tetratricopeptide repeat protein [Methanosarcina lacustris]AKB75108.1 TPR-domain containing protein [Methanosarcina lacustris Z-7289]
MSRQAEDLLNRNLKDISSLIEDKKYKKALEKLDKAENLAGKAKRQDLLCRVLLQKGEVLFSMHKPDEGQNLYDKALDIFRASDLNEDEDSVLQSTLSNTFRELARHFKMAESVENAENCYMNEIKVYEILLEKNPEDDEPKMEIARAFAAIGDLYVYFEPEDMDPETKRQYYEKILDVREKAFELLDDSETYIYALAHALGKLVDFYIIQQDYESAIQLQERVVEVMEELIDLLANWKDLKAKSNAYDKLGSLYAEVGKEELAEEQYSEALEYYVMIFDDEIWPLSVKMRLAAEVMERGKTLLLSKKYDSAKESMDLAFDFLGGVDKEELKDSVKEAIDLAYVLLGERDEEGSEDSGYLAEMAGISTEYAKTLSDLNRNEDAEKFTAKSEKIFRQLAEEGNKDS